MQFAPPPLLKFGKPSEEEEKDEPKPEPSSPKNEEKDEVLPKGPYGGIKEDSKYNMQDPKFSQYFPWGDKMWYSLKGICCGCFIDRFASTSEMIRQKGKPAAAFSKDKHEDKIMKLAINCTGLLELDDKVIHPFVKVHILDISTGKYLAKANPGVQAVSNKENVTVIQHSDTGNEVRDIDSDFIPPFATRYCDLRITGENRAEFYESFLINEGLDSIYNENTVLLFEILDYNQNLILSDSPLLRQNLYPVAWAYLRPLGESLVHSSTKRLQLYRYKFSPTADFYKEAQADIRTPLVYFDFNWPTHTEYSSFLEIDISFAKSQQKEIVQRPSLNVFEEEIGTRFIESSPRKQQDKKHMELKMSEKENESKDMKLREKLISWERGFGQPCLIPNKLVYRFETEEKGCFAIKFSNKGRYLAAACSESEDKCLLKIFNVETGNLVGTIGQHQGIIYELKWSITDDFLLSVSKDSIAKLWLCGDLEGSIVSAENYTENEQKLLLGTLQHPSYVYSAEFLPEYANKLRINPVIATACFDGKVRVWVVTVDEDTGRSMEAFCAAELSVDQAEHDIIDSGHYLLSHNYPTSLVFDDTGRLYIGDSRGYIHVWDVIARQEKVTITEIKTIKEPEIVGETINKVLLDPIEKRKIIVHSRDNCIRLLDHNAKRHKGVSLRYFGLTSKQYKVRSCVSPDGQYVLSGSEEGVPHMWDYASAIEYSTKQYECCFAGLITDVDWNPVYNMIVMCGYGKPYPLLIYVHEREQRNLLAYNLGQQELKKEKLKVHDENVASNKKDRKLNEHRVLSEIGNNV